LHRRAAAAIEQRSAGSLDENAALIAEHLEAAGDLHAAFSWDMRAGAWAATRDVVAAWASWKRARQVADALPADDADRTAMRIAARAWLCGNAFRVYADISGGLFEELRELCTAAGDKPSLAIGMVGLALEHNRHGRVREASRLASETMALVESIAKPTLTIELSLAAISIKSQTAEVAEALRWSQSVIDLADGDPTKGNFTIGSPDARWAVPGGATITTGRSPSPAAPTRCRMPGSSHPPTVSRWQAGCRWPTTPRYATSRRRWGSSSDQVRISRWA